MGAWLPPGRARASGLNTHTQVTTQLAHKSTHNLHLCSISILKHPPQSADGALPGRSGAGPRLDQLHARTHTKANKPTRKAFV